MKGASQAMPQLKVVVIGNESVGKTSLVSRWTNGPFEVNTAPTVGGAQKTKDDLVDGQMYRFQIWDTAGAERVVLFSNSSTVHWLHCMQEILVLLSLSSI